MTLPRSVADVLSDHVTLEVECIDRMYLNVYVPRLQFDVRSSRFLQGPPGCHFRLLGAHGPDDPGFVTDIEPSWGDHGVDLVTFAKGHAKTMWLSAYLAEFEGDEGVLFVGKAQEKTTAFRTEKRRNPETGQPYPWIVRTTAM